jgi:transketolase
MTDQKDLDFLAINTIRTLSMDAVQAANSGHPGAPMGLAPVAYCLWQRFLRYDPGDPIWPNRDRFILSAGHASMLLYSLLHLAGVRSVDADYHVQSQLSVPLDEIKRFRQLESGRGPASAWAWRSPGSGWASTSTGPSSSFSTSTSMRWPATVA